MKYNEFKEKVKALGNECVENENFIAVLNTNIDKPIKVFKRRVHEIDVNICIAIPKHMQILKLAIELAETPLDERVDEKLYYVKLPTEAKNNTLNKYRTDGRIFFDNGKENATFQTKFTKEQIKQIDWRLWVFAVEVEE